MAYVYCILQIERLGELRQIIGIGIEIISIPWLAGSPMASSIMGDTAITALRQKEHLILECVRAQRPAVAEDNRLSLAPVVVIDPRSIFCRDLTHTSSS